MADFGGVDLSAFRDEVRAWIAANFPPALTGAAAPEGRELSPEQDAWRRAVGEKGWGVPTWPAAYGGGGLGRRGAGDRRGAGRGRATTRSAAWA